MGNTVGVRVPPFALKNEGVIDFLIIATSIDVERVDQLAMNRTVVPVAMNLSPGMSV